MSMRTICVECHLQQYSLRVKLSKCRFFQDELEFLGAHNLTRRGQANTGKGGQLTGCKESKDQGGAEVIHRLDDLQCEVSGHNNQCVTSSVPLAEEECKMIVV